jgi:glycosyltransferase involved in cell wall biosynthesis
MSTAARPLVTCIIPTKNRPQLVSRAIKSVLRQSYEKIEIIVIDDSTNTDTRQTLAEFGSKIIYIKNDLSKGAPYSRNIGLREAKGEIISFLDDDDIWVQQKIESQLKLIPRYPIISCNYTTLINRKKNYIRRPELVTYESMLYYNYLGSCSCVMVAADAIVGCFFDENITLGQDWDMWLSIMKKNGIKQAANVDRYLVDYNSGEHSRISNRVEPMPVLLSIYNKYRDEHSVFTTKMFYLYNMVSAEKSFIAAIARELLKITAKKKKIFFLISVFLNRLLFRRTVVY